MSGQSAAGDSVSEDEQGEQAEALEEDGWTEGCCTVQIRQIYQVPGPAGWQEEKPRLGFFEDVTGKVLRAGTFPVLMDVREQWRV